MTMLHIRDLDPATHAALAQRARQQHRSVSAQAAAMLGEVLGAGENAKARRRAVLAHVEGMAGAWPTGLPTPESLLAEDRQR